MAHYLFNVAEGGDASELRARAAERLRAARWPVGDGERHRDSLSAGDLALVYLAAPVREFIARVELGSAVSESGGEVLLSHIEEWDPGVPVAHVLARIDTSAGARADFDTAVLRVTEAEYEAALAVAGERG